MADLNVVPKVLFDKSFVKKILIETIRGIVNF